MKRILLIVVATLTLGCVGAATAAELLDEPIAIVADRVILRSEWEAQVMLMAMQMRRQTTDPVVRDSIAPAILEQMINDELILIQAERDTTLTVTADEIDAALTQHIQSLRDQFKSEDEFQSELAKEGLTERDLRVRYRRDVRNQLLKQKLIQRKLGEVSVSNGEVREFYSSYRDSLPVQPDAIKLAHILMPVRVSDETETAARLQITQILQQIHDGMSFEDAAKQYSQDMTASSGGDLGWFGRGDMVPSFEEAAFNLAPGQVSGVVRTRYGLHLIQCVEKSGTRVHARHILIRLAPSAADSTRVYALADSVATVAKNGGNFCALAQQFSEDEESQKNCGELGWYPIQEMFPEFKAALTNAKIGDIVGPVSTQFGWHILQVLDRKSSKPFTLTDDWDAIKEMARREKTNKVVSDWIQTIRAETYVDVRATSAHEEIKP